MSEKESSAAPLHHVVRREAYGEIAPLVEGNLRHRNPGLTCASISGCRSPVNLSIIDNQMDGRVLVWYSVAAPHGARKVWCMFSQLGSLSPVEWIIAVIAMILVGVSRTGFRGSAFVAVPIFAVAFGHRLSTSVVLLMYITADLVAIQKFSRTVVWKIVAQLAPWAAIGVLAGTVFGMYVDDRFFGKVIAGIVMLGLIISVVRELRNNPVGLHDRKWLAAPLGIAGGFSSMIGNAAGPMMTMYMLALGLDKQKFLGTVAWFFFLMNVFKLPLHIFVWKTISGPSLMVNVVAIVPILIGTVIGGWLSARVSERAFRIVSFVLAAAGAVRLVVM